MAAMGEPFIGEIRMFAGNFAPNGWVICRGQDLLINKYSALYSIIETKYGGNVDRGIFTLPDFRGRLPVHFSETAPVIIMGQQGGEQSNVLTHAQVPPHTHRVSTQPIKCNSSREAVNANDPTGKYPGYSSKDLSYLKDNTKPGYAADAETTVEIVGSGSPIENRMPSLCVNFIIAFEGLKASY
jgi:microcystin-dependent protein